MQTRIARDAADLQHVWQSSAPERLWTGAFVRPVPGRSVSRFGTRSIFNGQLRNPHNGGDFMSPAGTPIEAPNAGRVALARDLYFSGNTVVIDHGLSMFSTLAHMSQIAVRELTYEADMLQARTFRSFETYFVVTLVYLLMSMALRRLLVTGGRRVLGAGVT